MTGGWSRDADYSDRANAAMCRDVYPLWFPHGVTSRDVTGMAADLGYAIDRVLEVTGSPNTGLREPIQLFVQERFRREDPYDLIPSSRPPVRYRDEITITTVTGRERRLPSELYKLGAQLFVYGFYRDHPEDRIVEARAFDVARIMHGILTEKIHISREVSNGAGQKFVGIGARDLTTVDALLYSYAADRGTS